MILLTSLLSLASLTQVIDADVEKHFRIPESADAGFLVGYVTDKQLNINIQSFMIIYPPESDTERAFAVSENSGEIRTRIGLDYETRHEYSFLAIPINGSDGIRVIIDVVDENDNAPIFPVTQMDIQLSEYARLNAEVPLRSATDADSTEFSVKHYRIASGNVNNAFRLSTKRLNNILYLDLIVNSELDREFRDKYMLQVEAVDGGDPPLTATMMVNITIIDANDNAPEFDQPRYLTQIAQNATIGTRVLQVHAIDKDIGSNAVVEYRLMPSAMQAHKRFAIDAQSGVITTAEPLTLYAQREYELLVVAKDGGVQSLESTTFVQIKIVNTREQMADISVIFSSDDASAMISEGSAVGDLVARISINDVDSARAASRRVPIELSLFGAQSHFRLQSIANNDVWVMLVNGQLDRESIDRYHITLTASDSSGVLATKNLTLRVGDINDNAPRFSQPRYEADVREKSTVGASVIKVTATDSDKDDNGRVTYSIAPSDRFESWFDIDTDTGLIVTSSAIDCEISSRPEIVVVATDHGRPQLTATATVGCL